MTFLKPTEDEVAWIKSKRDEFKQIGTPETAFDNVIEVIIGEYQIALDDCLLTKEVPLDHLIDVQYSAYCSQSEENCEAVKRQITYLLKLRAEGIYLGFKDSVLSINMIASYLIRAVLNDFSQEVDSM